VYWAQEESMKLKFLLAGPYEIDSLLDMQKAFYSLEHITFDETIAHTVFQQLLDDASIGMAYVIYLDSEPVGYFVITFGFSLEFNGRFALIDELYVRESSRRKGIGRSSLSFIEKLCREREINVIRLEVARENLRAQDLYRRVGFRDHGRDLLTKRIDGKQVNP
jgi:ribosomal protein S18 acetylase RimI-like enzyme